MSDSRKSRRYVPYYVEKAILRIMEDKSLAKRLTELLPEASYQAGAALLNAYETRRQEMNR
jgi:hypothetical protein